MNTSTVAPDFTNPYLVRQAMYVSEAYAVGMPANPSRLVANIPLKDPDGIVVHARLCSRQSYGTFYRSGGVEITAYLPNGISQNHYKIERRLRPGWTEQQLLKAVEKLYAEARERFRLNARIHALMNKCDKVFRINDYQEKLERMVASHPEHHHAYSEMDDADVDFWDAWMDRLAGTVGISLAD